MVSHVGEACEGAPSECVLRAEHLCFSYGQRSVLEDVSISVHRGEVVGILGPNGTGKSTLLALLAGDIVPHSGSVQLCATRIENIPRRRRAQLRAVMPQSFEVPFSYTAREIVAMGRVSWPRSDEDDAIIDSSLAAAGVAHLAGRDVTKLSGGEKARVTFARVLAQRAQVMLLDEPTAALDIAHQEALMSSVRANAQAGIGVVVVMHDLSLAGAYCDRLVLLHDGAVFAAGSVADVLTSENLSQVYECGIDVFSGPDGTRIVSPKRNVR